MAFSWSADDLPFLRSVDDLKGDLLPLVQAAETCTLDGADVNKDILSAAIRLR